MVSHILNTHPAPAHDGRQPSRPEILDVQSLKLLAANETITHLRAALAQQTQQGDTALTSHHSWHAAITIPHDTTVSLSRKQRRIHRRSRLQPIQICHHGVTPRPQRHPLRPQHHSYHPLCASEQPLDTSPRSFLRHLQPLTPILCTSHGDRSCYTYSCLGMEHIRSGRPSAGTDVTCHERELYLGYGRDMRLLACLRHSGGSHSTCILRDLLERAPDIGGAGNGRRLHPSRQSQPSRSPVHATFSRPLGFGMGVAERAHFLPQLQSEARCDKSHYRGSTS